MKNPKNLDELIETAAKRERLSLERARCKMPECPDVRQGHDRWCAFHIKEMELEFRKAEVE